MATQYGSFTSVDEKPVTKNATIRCLKRAKKLATIALCKGSYARDSQGLPCDEQSEKAACFCPMGAVIHVAGWKPVAHAAVWTLSKTLLKKMPNLIAQNSVQVWYDAYCQGVLEVEKLFDEAIKMCRLDVVKTGYEVRGRVECSYP